MFEDRTYENILAEMLAMAPADIDTRQGSVYYDMTAPAAFMLSRYYNEMSISFELWSIDTAEGEYLDEKGKEHNVYRLPAVANTRNVTFIGATVAANQRFFCNNQYFVTKYDENATLIVMAESAGEAPNNISAGTALVPVNTIPGLTAATLGVTITPGSEKENDTNFRRRIKDKIAKSSENGNKQHYKTWCEEIAGVGIARIAPLWNGPNTVKGILIDPEGLPASNAVVEEVQNHIDPGSTGLGEGVANIGAYFIAVAASANMIDISFNVQLDAGVSLASVQEACTPAIQTYFKDTALANQTNTSVLIRTSAIANIIYDIPGVIDYSGITINGGTANISIPYTDVPVLGVLAVGQI